MLPGAGIFCLAPSAKKILHTVEERGRALDRGTPSWNWVRANALTKPLLVYATGRQRRAGLLSHYIISYEALYAGPDYHREEAGAGENATHR